MLKPRKLIVQSVKETSAFSARPIRGIRAKLAGRLKLILLKTGGQRSNAKNVLSVMYRYKGMKGVTIFSVLSAFMSGVGTVRDQCQSIFIKRKLS